jgi:hypothetical protein
MPNLNLNQPFPFLQQDQEEYALAVLAMTVTRIVEI